MDLTNLTALWPLYFSPCLAELQRSPGFSFIIQPMPSVPPLLPQNLKTFSLRTSCPFTHVHFSEMLPVSTTHRLIRLLSPLSLPTPIHNTCALFSAPPSPAENIRSQSTSKVPEPLECLLRKDISWETGGVTHNTARSSAESLFLYV